MAGAPYSREQQLRGTQILTVGLIVGVCMFALIVVFVIGALDQPSSGWAISAFGAAMALGMFILHLFAPDGWVSLICRLRSADMSDDVVMYGAYRIRLILRLAMLEFAAFFNLIVCVVEHNWWSFGISSALVLWMLIAFPTRTRVEQWIETQRMQHQP